MSKIISIGTAVPAYRHEQNDILRFMQMIYAANEADKRKMKFLYHHSGIDTRYSVISDYSRDIYEWKFYPQSENLEPFPSLEQRMMYYNKYAPALSVDAIRNCLDAVHSHEITHLITVSCTGMSAPGLDLQIMELMDLPKTIYRTSVNFMGCYAAIHALKIADSICKTTPGAQVMIVCTELCTLHFQHEKTIDNITSSLLFADGAGAALVCHDDHARSGLHLKHFYSEVITRGKRDMAWELSSSGFVMTLSGYVPELIKEDFAPLVKNAFQNSGCSQKDATHWCIHPGGKRILDAICKTLEFTNGELKSCYDVLREYGNMSSATMFFVLNRILQELKSGNSEKDNVVFGASFGPGLTMETFVASSSD